MVTWNKEILNDYTFIRQMRHRCALICDKSYRIDRMVPIFEDANNGILAYNHPDFFIVAFTGTRVNQGRFRLLNDLRADLSFWSKKSDKSNCYFHSGFYKEFQDRRDSLLRNSIVSLFPKNKPLIFTGHSLGGSLSLIASIHYQEFHPLVFAYGVPSVLGDRAAVEIMRQRKNHYYLYVHRSDPVWYTRVISNYLRPVSSPYESFADMVHLLFPPNLQFLVSAHSLDLYIRSMERLNR